MRVKTIGKVFYGNVLSQCRRMFEVEEKNLLDLVVE